ncbi:hypothetical protein J1N35_025648 [Gossypium stocksii]|uniref:Putative plant transposon protein domain-containing protein n=1 Tax=Gossypium stocksii TaxID=47602 RepID=A0A9D3ZWE4_9ROSI|nr:hypothetical protein J1N35_025648 [Gossypium stocksii]
MGYTEVVSSVVEKHGWGIFYLHPYDVLSKVVKEFYAHITSLNNAFIYVCCALVLFDKDSINAQYGLSKGPDEHADFVKAMSPECLVQVLVDVCIEGTQWSISRINCDTIDRISLKPQCKIWYHFLKTHLIPSTPNATICKDRLLLLHSIIVGRKINVGKIIFCEIRRCAQRLLAH